MGELIWDDTIVTSTATPGVDCGPLVYSFEMTAGGTIENIFGYDATTPKFVVFTDDFDKDGLYSIDVKVEY